MNLKHIGAEAFYAERNSLLAEYDKAKAQTADDAVQVDHGIVAEALWRRWLTQFLPKRFGVTKGYIITHNLDYEGPLEEWDVIVYDRLESPVLFVRGTEATTGKDAKQAIPVEHVRGVIEVKATFNKPMVEKAANKLSKLRVFASQNESPRYPKYLVPPFLSGAVFFETAVKDQRDYCNALDALLPLCDEPISIGSCFVLRSQTNSDHCAELRFIQAEQPVNLGAHMEMSSWKRVGTTGNHISVGCLMGWGVNPFASYMFDFAAVLAGTYRPGFASSFYGLNFEQKQHSSLFSWPTETPVVSKDK